MTISLGLACLWVVVACTVAMLPSQRNHWPQAYALMAVGVPLLGYVTYENGPVAGLVALFAGASILRWPLRFLGNWVKQRVSRSGRQG